MSSTAEVKKKRRVFPLVSFRIKYGVVSELIYQQHK